MKTTRRNMLGTLLGGAASIGFLSNEEKVLADQGSAEEDSIPATSVDARSSATRKNTDWSKLSDLREKMPESDFLGIPMSRMILGGNLVSGYAHARDLLYVSDLVRAYHTREKTFATFKLAEACGINCFLMNPQLCELVNEYWEKEDGTLQFMTNCSGKTAEILYENIMRSIQFDATSVVLQGEVCDRLVAQKDFDTIRRSLDLIRAADLPAGIAAHRLETLKICVQQRIIPDYWMKTFHHLQYWSASAGHGEHDNIFCRDPMETRDFMKDRPEPWIAFKVLAAGAIPPKVGFKYAFEGGADFICVGMYDFQIVDDVNLCVDILRNRPGRQRPWIGGSSYS